MQVSFSFQTEGEMTECKQHSDNTVKIVGFLLLLLSFLKYSKVPVYTVLCNLTIVIISVGGNALLVT